jgi:hypothetical protein
LAAHLATVVIGLDDQSGARVVAQARPRGKARLLQFRHLNKWGKAILIAAVLMLVARWQRPRRRTIASVNHARLAVFELIRRGAAWAIRAALRAFDLIRL